MRWCALLLLAACGDNGDEHDPRVTGECIATFAGNFTDASTSVDNCPAPRSELEFFIPSEVLGDKLGIALTLGRAPLPGRYTPTTVAPWSAFAIRQVATGACIYQAGDTAVPPGWFVLDLDEGGHHGTLVIEQHVLAIQGTDCGPGSTETVTIEF